MLPETSLPEPARARLNFWAILLGSIVDIVSTYLGAALLLVFFAENVIVALLLSGLTMTAFGGYVAAAVAGRRSLAHGLGVGILSIASALVLERLSGGGSPIPYPSWYPLLAYGLTVPAAVLGGWVRRRFWGERLVAAGPWPGVYPNLKQAIWLLLLFITVAVITGVGFVVGLGFRGRAFVLQWAVAVALAGAAVGYALILAWAVRKARAPVAELFPIRTVRVAWLWPAIVTIIGATILFSEMANLIRRAFSVPRVPIDPTFFGGSEGMFWATATFVIVLTPIAEELLFRGVILRGFLSHYTTRNAIVVSSILFGISHLNPFQATTAMVLGVLFAWWRVKTGSLLLPLLGHALNNALALAVPRLPWVNVPAVTGAAAGQFQPLWFDLVGVLLLTGGILQFARVARAQAADPA